ncbi:thermosome subunit [Candidatus Methanoperedens nitroreducens]|uniref:Thermosome subunit n=1 Tax=Candidatus Methanoperedens nitratireducens TaxID=1392998 RepID=A0A062VET2_9EURY|nr:thermosome subunit alpha [Candidatus Methanoperedens nitroreducens]KCZ73705.1 thermosome subunit [Candidatus Methanoperedens nitroreducens]MDJ1422336.1 thermosome subunit alpha [Candidatus Methanoperedens sp.]
MAAQLGGQPIIILKEGTERIRGREARSNNIIAAKAVAAAIRTTLGPKGMDKMLVGGGDITITNDGVTILREMDIEHPAAKMLVEVAKTQDDEVGDGTTTAAVLTGELLVRAEELLEQDVHPTVIVAGYRIAAEKAVEFLGDITYTITENDTAALLNIAKTAMTGKGAEGLKEKLAGIVVEAIRSIVDEEDGKKSVDIDNIKIEKKVGRSVEGSELIRGIVLDKNKAHHQMQDRVTDAKIALITRPIEFSKMELDAEIKISTPGELAHYLDQEEQIVRDIVNRIETAGANVVLCQLGIDDIAQHFLAKAGILAIERVEKKDIERVARATGANLITSVDDFEASDIGSAGLVELRGHGEDKMLYIKECSNPRAVSILIRGGTEHVLDSTERALEDALRAVGVAIEDETLVSGAGSPEIELALRLNEYASTLKGREQLAVIKFAQALEVIPKTLAENAGLDPIDMLVELRSQHEKGKKDGGLNVFTGEVEDMWENGVIEPLRVKIQAINSATEAAIMILRIDDVLAATGGMEHGGECGPGGCGMGGMGGMPPGMMM